MNRQSKGMGAYSMLVGMIALSVAACSQQRASITGTYVGIYADAAILLEIVQTEDGKVTGNFSSAIIDKKSGRVADAALSVTGSVNDDHVAFEFKRLTPPMVTLSFGGTIKDGAMKIHTDAGNGGQLFKFELRLGQVSEFEAQAKKLRDQSQAYLTAKAEADRKRESEKKEQETLSNINLVLANINAFHDRVEKTLPEFPKSKAHCAQITADMTETLEKERKAGSWSERSKIAYNLAVSAELGGPTQQVLNSLSSFKQTFATAARDIQIAFDRLSKTCAGTKGRDNFTSSCESLNAASKQFHDDNHRFTTALFDAGRQCVDEIPKQRRIAAEGNHLQ